MKRFRHWATVTALVVLFGWFCAVFLSLAGVRWTWGILVYLTGAVALGAMLLLCPHDTEGGAK